jgi:hypothetical protein
MVFELPIAVLSIDCWEEHTLKLFPYVVRDFNVLVAGHLLDIDDFDIPVFDFVNFRFVILHEEALIFWK